MGNRTPEKTDAIVGANVRGHRRRLGVSQSEIASFLGITFQQVQKYENGSNRISASNLALISQKLKVPIEDLFADTQALVGQHGRMPQRAYVVCAVLDGIPLDHQDQFMQILRGVARSFECLKPDDEEDDSFDSADFPARPEDNFHVSNGRLVG